jgi:hypothetical protein
MSASPPPSLAREHQELLALLGYWKTLAGAAAGLLTALPFGGLALGELFAPGQEKVTPIVAGVFTVLCLLLVYYTFRDSAPDLVQTWGTRLIVTGLALLFAYMIIWFALIKDVDGTKQLLGFSLTDQAREAVQKRTAASDTPKDLLKTFGYESADRIWQWRGAAQVLLFSTFTIGCVCAASGFFLLTLRNLILDRIAAAAAAAGAGS